MYEIHCDFGAASFNNEDDAISALWLLGKYHNIEIDFKTVKEGLENKAFYEKFPLPIIKGE